MAEPETGLSWRERECTIRLDQQWVREWTASAQRSMGMWNNADIGFKFVEVSSSYNDIVSSPLGRWGGRLANTLPEYEGEHIVGVRIMINLYYKWTPAHPREGKSPERYDLTTCIAHELGHALELFDVCEGETVMMTGWMDPEPDGVRTITKDDIAAAQRLYRLAERPRVERVPASAVIRLGLDELAQESDLIIEGMVEVAELRTFAGRDQRRVACTDYEVHVENQIENKAGTDWSGSKITVRTLGPPDSSGAGRRHSDPSLKPGQTVVLFLSKDDGNGFIFPKLEARVFTIFGGMQGKFNLSTLSGERVVTGLGLKEGIPLTVFHERIREAIRGGEIAGSATA